MKHTLPLLGLVLVLASPAAAQEKFRRLSVTVDPLWLAADLRQVTVEARPVSHWSGALVLGHGSGRSYFLESPTWHVGAQARWYPREAAKLEPHFIAEVAGGRTEYEEWSPEDESADLSVALGGGYKYTAGTGFTLEAQGGIMAYGHEYRREEPYMALTPYATLAVGWSFL
jgi:hypothetical protein